MTDDFSPAGPDDEGEGQFEELRSGLAMALAEFADDNDIDPDLLSLLLIDSAVTQRALAYALATDETSEAGLKLELDRFESAFGELIGEAKNEATTMLANLREVVEELDRASGAD